MRYQGSAGYAPGSDRILIAPRETFLSDETFTRVLLHEMTHSTGHPSALNRGCNTNFGSPEYAQEELVAELGSLFLSADLGIQSADYEGGALREPRLLSAIVDARAGRRPIIPVQGGGEGRQGGHPHHRALQRCLGEAPRPRRGTRTREGVPQGRVRGHEGCGEEP